MFIKQRTKRKSLKEHYCPRCGVKFIAHHARRWCDPCQQVMRPYRYDQDGKRVS